MEIEKIRNKRKLINKKIRKWKLVESLNIVDSNWLKLLRNTYLLPNNTVIDDYYISRERDVALVVAFDKESNVLLTKEYRPGINDFSVELPAGFMEEFDQTIESTAIREFREETGFKLRKLEFLGKYYRSTGRSKDTVSFFLGLGAYEENGLYPDESETLTSFLVPFKKALKMVEDGEIVQQSSAMGLLLAEKWLAENSIEAKLE